MLPFYSQAFNRDLWIGLTCTSNSPSTCTWLDGTPFDYATSKPYMYQGGQCIAMSNINGDWQATSCNEEYYYGFLCEVGQLQGSRRSTTTTATDSSLPFPPMAFGEPVAFADAVERCQGNLGSRILSVHVPGEASAAQALCAQVAGPAGASWGLLGSRQAGSGGGHRRGMNAAPT